MLTYHDCRFVLSESARIRMEEYPSLKAIFRIFEAGLRARPADATREVVDGMIRYRIVKEWVWAYILNSDGDKVVYTVLSADLVSEISFGERISAALSAIVKNYVPHAQDVGEAIEAFRNPG